MLYHFQVGRNSRGVQASPVHQDVIHDLRIKALTPLVDVGFSRKREGFKKNKYLWSILLLVKYTAHRSMFVHPKEVLYPKSRFVYIYIYHHIYIYIYISNLFPPAHLATYPTCSFRGLGCGTVSSSSWPRWATAKRWRCGCEDMFVGDYTYIHIHRCRHELIHWINTFLIVAPQKWSGRLTKGFGYPCKCWKLGWDWPVSLKCRVVFDEISLHWSVGYILMSQCFLGISAKPDLQSLCVDPI